MLRSVCLLASLLPMTVRAEPDCASLDAAFAARDDTGVAVVLGEPLVMHSTPEGPSERITWGHRDSHLSGRFRSEYRLFEHGEYRETAMVALPSADGAPIRLRPFRGEETWFVRSEDAESVRVLTYAEYWVGKRIGLAGDGQPMRREPSCTAPTTGHASPAFVYRVEDVQGRWMRVALTPEYAAGIAPSELPPTDGWVAWPDAIGRITDLEMEDYQPGARPLFADLPRPVIELAIHCTGDAAQVPFLGTHTEQPRPACYLPAMPGPAPYEGGVAQSTTELDVHHMRDIALHDGDPPTAFERVLLDPETLTIRVENASTATVSVRPLLGRADEGEFYEPHWGEWTVLFDGPVPSNGVVALPFPGVHVQSDVRVQAGWRRREHAFYTPIYP